MLRLFVAIDLPAAITRSLGERTAPLHDDRTVRWVASRTLHLTLAFLGDTDEARVPEVVGALREAAAVHGPLDLVIGGFGTFPRRGPPRVLWVGVEGDVPGLLALVHDVEQSLLPLGWPPPRRPFHPHVTLGRVKRGTAARVIVELADLGTVGRLVAEDVVLFASELTPQGAVHTPLARAPLRAQIPSTE